MPRQALIGMLLGLFTELGAWGLGLWVYRQSQTSVLNVILMFGLVMGSIASLVPSIGIAPAYWLGFAAGLAYEVLNLRVLKWWYFPGERLLFLRGHTAIVIGLAILWGILPVVIARAQTLLPRTRVLLAAAQREPKRHPTHEKPSVETRLEQINEKERRLLEKLDAVHKRERDIENRLEQVRMYKQMLLARQGVIKPGTQGMTPTPSG